MAAAEAIDAARAQLTGAQPRGRKTQRRERDRAAEIRSAGLNAQADLDRTETALRSAEAERDAAGANLAEFLNGSRVENIELAAARLRPARLRSSCAEPGICQATA
ncbi:MAG: hypothetical protein IPF57_18615 [Gammaproteobacteria bacterium]|nr:hypothetical protein [Gammaproteobacteria bacterium]